MKFFMEKNKDESYRVKINIPRIIIEKNIVNKYIQINKNTNINGFRKGKIPINIIKKKYGDTIYFDVLNKLMKKFFHEYLNKKKIKIIGYPQYFLHNNTENKENFEYSVIYDKYPDFKIEKINDIEVKKIIVNVTDDDIKKNILKNQNTKEMWKTVNRSAKNYDRITIDYSLYENNKKIKTFISKSIRFIVSKNDLIDDLNNKIINHFINDIIFLKIIFDPFHPQKELHNKNITCKIKILNIEEKYQKEIEQKNCSKLNIEDLRNTTIKKINTLTENYLNNQIIHQLIKKNPINIPPNLLKEEKKLLHNKIIEEYKEKEGNIFEKKYHINLTLLVKKRIRIKLITDYIIMENKLFITKDQIKSLIHQISLNYKKPLEIVNIYNKNKQLKKIIEESLLEINVIQFLRKNIRIVQKNWNFNKIMNYKWNQEEFYIN